MDFDSLKNVSDSLGKIDLSGMINPDMLFPKIELPDMSALEPIDPEDTIIGEIKRKIEEQNNLASQQISILVEQNRLLGDNYSKLKDMYDTQAESYKAAQEDLKSSRKYNVVMMVIAIIAMLAAIAGPIVTILVSR